MSGKIFIASRDAVFPGDKFKHSYLVYDADGDMNTTSGQILIVRLSGCQCGQS